MTQPTTKTPRTDAETWTTIAGAFKCSGANGNLAGTGEYVPTNLSRQLETELNEWRECADRLAEFTSHSYICKVHMQDSGCTCGYEQIIKRFEQLKTKYGNPRANP